MATATCTVPAERERERKSLKPPTIVPGTCSRQIEQIAHQAATSYQAQLFTHWRAHFHIVIRGAAHGCNQLDDVQPFEYKRS